LSELDFIPAMALNAGVLIIGSLYWDDKPIREAWRQSRLRSDLEFNVRVPIRYGRKSLKRGKTYSIVFSPQCELGQAKVIACRNPLSSVDDLVTETEELWAAESSATGPKQKIAADWGCIVLLTRPTANIPQPFLDGWAKRTQQEDSYGITRSSAIEVIVNRGLLNIAWPILVADGSPVPLDLLFATATQPTLEGNPPTYPDAKTIAEAWKRDREGNGKYFLSNRQHGICTFQDQAITEFLR
jgi:hypothetical protein